MKTIFIDAGHGGINPTTGKYTTPGKGFSHTGQVFHDGGHFYEGVFNRQMAKRITAYLKEALVPVLPVSHKWQDTTLDTRVNLANRHHQQINPGIYVSLHANAAQADRAGKARGFEIFTSIGKTVSDRIAEDIYQAIAKAFPEKRMRSDTSDGDHDKEANFRVLTRTNMPAVLLEFGFFDNIEDAKMLNSIDWQDKMARVVASVLIEWAKK